MAVYFSCSGSSLFRGASPPSYRRVSRARRVPLSTQSPESFELCASQARISRESFELGREIIADAFSPRGSCSCPGRRRSPARPLVASGDVSAIARMKPPSFWLMPSCFRQAGRMFAVGSPARPCHDLKDRLSSWERKARRGLGESEDFSRSPAPKAAQIDRRSRHNRFVRSLSCRIYL